MFMVQLHRIVLQQADQEDSKLPDARCKVQQENVRDGDFLLMRIDHSSR